MAETQERNWVEEVGKPAYDTIAEMVAALEADRDRLEELRDEWTDWRDLAVENSDPDNGGLKRLSESEVTRQMWANAGHEDEAQELAELEAAVTLDGEEVDEDEARERINEDPLSVRIFGERVDGEWEATNYELLLTTGGPAVRIVGDLNNGEATSARLEVQDWGKPWTEYYPADSDVLMAYVSCFYFGE